MSVKEFIKEIQKKPKAWMHEVRTDYLEYILIVFLL